MNRQRPSSAKASRVLGTSLMLLLWVTPGPPAAARGVHEFRLPARLVAKLAIEFADGYVHDARTASNWTGWLNNRARARWSPQRILHKTRPPACVAQLLGALQLPSAKAELSAGATVLHGQFRDLLRRQPPSSETFQSPLPPVATEVLARAIEKGFPPETRQRLQGVLKRIQQHDEGEAYLRIALDMFVGLATAKVATPLLLPMPRPTASASPNPDARTLAR